jgi:hypothetical protein
MAADVQQRRLEDLLPWYLNGTLDSDSCAFLEARAGSHPQVSSEMRLLREVAAATRLDHLYYDEEGSRANLLQRVAEGERSQRPVRAMGADSTGWWARIADWLEPKFAFAMLVVVAQAAVLGGVFLGGEDSRYTDIRSPQSEQAVQGAAEQLLRVTFVASASEQEIRSALVAAGASIVAGPTQLGDYYLALSAADSQARIGMLRSSAVVDSVRPVARLPADLSSDEH